MRKIIKKEGIQNASGEDTRMKIGIIGTGMISNTYIPNLQKTFRHLDLVAVADLDIARAQKMAEEKGIPCAMTTDALIADPEIEGILNLTPPAAHYPITKAALEAGKHVWVEKPLSPTFAQGQELVNIAKAKNLKLGCAPDTILGSGMQTLRRIIDEGWIGTPVGALGHVMLPGAESGHPNPDFFYQPGGGPMFDLGPYWITALVNLFGAVTEVSATTHAHFAERVITAEGPRFGHKIPVQVPTWVSGNFTFANGAIGQVTACFETYPVGYYASLHIYGTEGSIIAPDPNKFEGPLLLKRGWNEAKEVPLLFPYSTEGRGIGMADIEASVRENRPNRASGELALHVLEAMQATHDSGEQKRSIALNTKVERPIPMPQNPLPGEV
jgi:predicted dehydrogenase